MAGVSVTTVSRVLNDHPYVNSEKKAAVWRAIEETGYQKNINAVHLSKGKTFMVGVVVPFVNHAYFGLLVEGIAMEALKNEYQLVLFQSNYEKSREEEALKMLRNKQIDALIICSRACDIESIETYAVYGPVVLCEDARGTNVSSVFIDHYDSFFQALTYLYSKGHREIGYSIGRQAGTNSRLREAAYKDFIHQYGLLYRHDYIYHNCFNMEDGHTVARSIIINDHPPTALLVSSDEAAAGILICCKENNMRVPNDLAIIGFNNQPIAKLMNITTLEIPLVEVGQKLFLQTMSCGDFSHEEVQVRLIERKTV